jgi:hypothetical protein
MTVEKRFLTLRAERRSPHGTWESEASCWPARSVTSG